MRVLSLSRLSSMAVKHGPYLLIRGGGGRGGKDPYLRNQVLEETSSHLLLGAQGQRLGAEQDRLPCGGPQEPLLATVKRRKRAWFGHATLYDCLSKTTLQGTLEGRRRCDRQRKCWMDNIKEWTSLPMLELLTRASYIKTKTKTKQLEEDLC